MFLPLTENYIATKFFQYCGKPFHNRAQKVYQGSCPLCREGKSWLKKRRCYYIVEKNVVCCHNCGWYGTPYNWVVKVTGMTFKDIKSDLENNDTFIQTYKEVKEKPNKEKTENLPQDSINLFDDKQIEYYKNNHVVRECLDVIVDRRLNTAINRPASLYTTLVDPVHCNRLIIPFIGIDNKIEFYQSRTIVKEDDRPKYLSKVGSEKSLYGINNIDLDIDYIFITEGPIDAMFIKNGVAIAGINESKTKNFTNTQESQLKLFPLHKRVWVLDNQFSDKTSKNKTKKLLEIGETVFIWPEEMKQYKDINDYCIEKSINEIESKVLLQNSYSGLTGQLLISRY